MDVYRPTKATIDLGAIRRNTGRIIAKYPGYKYYMAVVKADSYGYRGLKVVEAMLAEDEKEEGGIFLRRYITHYKKVQDYGKQ